MIVHPYWPSTSPYRKNVEITSTAINEKVFVNQFNKINNSKLLFEIISFHLKNITVCSTLWWLENPAFIDEEDFYAKI